MSPETNTKNLLPSLKPRFFTAYASSCFSCKVREGWNSRSAFQGWDKKKTTPWTDGSFDALSRLARIHLNFVTTLDPLPELFSTEISLLLFLMSIFVCVIRKKVAASVRHNELNPTHFEALPDAKILRDRVVWKYFPKGFICLKRGYVITVCIV